MKSRYCILIIVLGIISNVSSGKESNRQKILRKFIGWLQSGGANLGKLKPVWLVGEGYTVVSTTDIMTGELLAFVPDRLFIGPKAASQSNLAAFISHLPAPEQVSIYLLALFTVRRK